MYVNVYKDTKSMFITLNLGLPPTYPTIMANDFEAGPSHIKSNFNDGKFNTSFSFACSETLLFFFFFFCKS